MFNMTRKPLTSKIISEKENPYSSEEISKLKDENKGLREELKALKEQVSEVKIQNKTLE